MKNLNITYDDVDFEKLIKVKEKWERKKGKISWEDLVFMAIVRI